MKIVICSSPGCQTTAGCICDRVSRPPSMEQDPRVIALARQIYMRWMQDERWLKAHLHPPQAPQDYPIAYFWAELAAKAALASHVG